MNNEEKIGLRHNESVVPAVAMILEKLCLALIRTPPRNSVQPRDFFGGGEFLEKDRKREQNKDNNFETLSK